MHLTCLRSILFLTAALIVPATAAAQDWNMPWADPRDRPARVDISASTGRLMSTDWSDLVLLGSLSSISGAFEQILVRDVHLEPGPVVGAAVTYWKDRYGFRAHAARAKSSLRIGGDDSAPVDLETWFYDVRGAIGALEYTPQRWVWPYVFVGFGGITYDLARTVSPPLLTFVDVPRGNPSRLDNLVIVEENGRQFVITVDELRMETVFAVNFGAGTDFRIPLGPAGIGVRVEVSDHVAASPLGVRIHELNRFGALTTDPLVRFGSVHHLRATAGVVLQIGR